ncbi:MAG: permease [Dehalococcoidia bacterium]
MQIPIAPTVVMMAVALGMSIFAFHQNPALAWTGLKNGGSLLLQILPLLLAAVAVAGLAQVMLPREFVARWLGAESGWRGIAIGWLAGSITPGPPYVLFPLAAGIYKAGAGIGPIITFITAWSLIQFTRLPMELALLGPKLTLIRLGSVLIFPPLAGLIAQHLYGRFVT